MINLYIITLDVVIIEMYILHMHQIYIIYSIYSLHFNGL